METSFPKYLYHYTSQAGLLGIIQTKKVWMTNILYLNDSSEFIHTIDLVKKELENRKDQLIKKGLSLSQDNWEKMNADEKKYCLYDNLMFELNFESINDDIYVFSFSTEKNDLSQWRGYCPNGVGFCIEFETEKLSSIIIGSGCELIKCEYEKKEKEKIIKSSFNGLEPMFDVVGIVEMSLVNDFRNRFKDISDMEIIGLLYLIKIMGISSYLKDESFKNENEYRIFKKQQSVETKYRQGNSMIIPYIEVELSDKDGKLPISKIIVGPTPHPELSKLSIEGLLKKEKYDGIDVEKSNIPYRSW